MELFWQRLADDGLCQAFLLIQGVAFWNRELVVIDHHPEPRRILEVELAIGNLGRLQVAIDQIAYVDAVNSIAADHQALWSMSQPFYRGPELCDPTDGDEAICEFGYLLVVAGDCPSAQILEPSALLGGELAVRTGQHREGVIGGRRLIFFS